MNKLLWKLFYVSMAVILVDTVLKVMRHPLAESPAVMALFLGLPFVIAVLHAGYTLGWKRSLLFASLASGIGWMMETLGLKDGVVFGGRYVYPKPDVLIGTVPLTVVAYWLVFIYTGYCLTNSIVYWLKRKKPAFGKNPWWQLVLLVVIDAWLVTAIDLFMDPVQVKMGTWQWFGGGPYFDIPTGNFVGWFIVAAMATGIFRMVEYLFPRNENKIDKTVFILPVGGYFAIAVCLSLMAGIYAMSDLIVIGNLLMVPPAALSAWLYWRRGWLGKTEV